MVLNQAQGLKKKSHEVSAQKITTGWDITKNVGGGGADSPPALLGLSWILLLSDLQSSAVEVEWKKQNKTKQNKTKQNSPLVLEADIKIVQLDWLEVSHNLFFSLDISIHQLASMIRSFSAWLGHFVRVWSHQDLSVSPQISNCLYIIIIIFLFCRILDFS